MHSIDLSLSLSRSLSLSLCLSISLSLSLVLSLYLSLSLCAAFDGTPVNLTGKWDLIPHHWEKIKAEPTLCFINFVSVHFSHNCSFSSFCVFSLISKRKESEPGTKCLLNNAEMMAHTTTDPVEMRRINFQTPGTHTCTYTHTHTHSHAHTDTQTLTSTHTHTLTRARAHTHTHTHTHTRALTHAHVHLHTHTHTHTWTRALTHTYSTHICLSMLVSSSHRLCFYIRLMIFCLLT